MKKLFTLKLCLLFVLLTVVVLPGRGQVIVAQHLDYSAGGIWLTNYNDPDDGYYYQGQGQSFKSLVTGSLGTIQFYVEVTQVGNTNIEIYACSSPNSWGSLLNTKTAVPVTATGWVTADVTALNIPVTAGNYYGFRLIPQTGLSGYIQVGPAPYPDGHIVTVQSNGSQSSSFNGYTFGFNVTAAVTLPITLHSFTAQKQGSNALLQWSTATEQNSKDFTVQHSIDGNSWKNIAALPAAGNSNAPRNYSYVHTNPGAGNNYYRLLQTDMDGKSSYTDVRMVKFEGNEPGFTVLANPVSSGVLRVHVNNTTSLSLYSSDGRLLWKKQLNAGVQSVDMSGCGKGVFLLKGDGAAEKVLVK